jgi:hypothetical protein
MKKTKHGAGAALRAHLRQAIRRKLKKDPEKTIAWLQEKKDLLPLKLRERLEKYLEKKGKPDTKEVTAIDEILETDTSLDEVTNLQEENILEGFEEQENTP